MCVCVCVSRLTLLHTFDVKNAVPCRIAVVRSEDASVCLCCHGTPFCVEDAAVCVCVCVCVVYKRIPFFFVSQSFEVKTLPCVSAVMELLFVSKTLQYVCVCVLWAREYRSFSYRSRSK